MFVARMFINGSLVKEEHNLRYHEAKMFIIKHLSDDWLGRPIEDWPNLEFTIKAQ
jgi:hypothetical protein